MSKPSILAALRSLVGRRSAEDLAATALNTPPPSRLRQVSGPLFAGRVRHVENWRGHTNPPDPRVFRSSGKAMRYCKAFRSLGIPVRGAQGGEA